MKRILVSVFFALLSQAVNAAQVTLSDGTLVFGTILRLSNGEDLVIDTAHMGAVTIDWEAVVSLRDTEVVEVELFDGHATLGQVALEGAQLLVDAGETLVVERSEIFALREVKDTFDERLSAYTDLGSNFVRGNNRVSQLSFGAGVAYDATQWRTGARLSSIVNEQTNAEDTRRLTFNADYAYKLGNGWQAGGSYQFESDEQQGLSGRSLFGIGAIKRLTNQRRHRLYAVGGLALNVEEFEGLPRNESIEAVLGANYRLRWIVDADISYTMYPSLEENGRVRTQLDGSLSFDLLSDLDFRITVYDRYDSQPPLGNKKNDSGLTLGLRWEY